MSLAGRSLSAPPGTEAPWRCRQVATQVEAAAAGDLRVSLTCEAPPPPHLQVSPSPSWWRCPWWCWESWPLSSASSGRNTTQPGGRRRRCKPRPPDSPGVVAPCLSTHRVCVCFSQSQWKPAAASRTAPRLQAAPPPAVPTYQIQVIDSQQEAGQCLRSNANSIECYFRV